MKRKLCIILVITLLLSGCAKNPANKHKSPVFYYPEAEIQYHTPQGILIEYQIPDNIKNSDLHDMLCVYLNGPADNQYSNPFPAGTKLQSISIADNNAILTLSKEYAELGQFPMIIASSCLTKTVCNLTKTNMITILVEGTVEPMIFHLDDIITMDQISETETTVTK